MSAQSSLFPVAAVDRTRALAVALIAACATILANTAFALSLSTSSLSITSGTTTNVTVTGTGAYTATSANANVATAKWATTNVAGTKSATLAVKAVGVGSTTVTVKDATNASLPLTVKVLSNLTVSPGALSLQTGATATLSITGAAGALTLSSADTTIATVPATGTVNVYGAGSVTVTAKAGDLAAGFTVLTVSDGKSTRYVPLSVVTATSSKPYTVFAWNNLGMHCMDGKDYSVFSILPPYNDLHAQVVSRASWSGPVAPKTVTGIATTTLSGLNLTYEAVADVAGSINTTSSNKTNFWSYVSKLYTSATVPENCGLTGNYTPSLARKALAYAAGPFASGGNAFTWFEATGLPITPYSDTLVNGAYVKNEYPTVLVTAFNGTAALASVKTVLPVSDEISCKNCHASAGPASSSATQVAWNGNTATGTWTTTTATVSALPSAPANNADVEKDWKLNILKKHDERRGTALYANWSQGKPTLCASCHASNALGTTGTANTPPLTAAVHAAHAYATDPTAANALLNDQSNRSACYNCHPGSTTKCLRGAMSDTPGVQCQSCHGNMLQVGSGARVGWLDQPNCQACHYNGTRQTSVFTNGVLTAPADQRFATNPNTPATGVSLFRFSKGHGNMQCESCHGATHAEYPSLQPNDNIQSIALQGYAGTVRECVACHSSPPQDAQLGSGPHGMHWTGPVWVSKHKDLAQANIASCAYCHTTGYTAGMTSAQIMALPFTGTVLSEVQSARTFVGKGTQPGGGGKLVSFSPNGSKGPVQVGCYNCHNGPMGQ